MAPQLTKQQIKNLQFNINEFREKYLEDIAPLIVDGEWGHATAKAVRFCKYYLGHTRDRDSYPGEKFRTQLTHPQSSKHSSKAALERGHNRRKEQRKLAKENRDNWRNVKGYAVFDGKNVPEWMVTWLQKARENGWRGVVVSGVRTAAYSIHLCYGICGAPRCPGLCAGQNSNHNMEQSQGYPHGALDVSDYINFGEIQKRLGSPLINRLPNDRVHYSVSGG